MSTGRGCMTFPSSYLTFFPGLWGILAARTKRREGVRRSLSLRTTPTSTNRGDSVACAARSARCHPSSAGCYSEFSSRGSRCRPDRLGTVRCRTSFPQAAVQVQARSQLRMSHHQPCRQRLPVDHAIGTPLAVAVVAAAASAPVELPDMAGVGGAAAHLFVPTQLGTLRQASPGKRAHLDRTTAISRRRVSSSA